MPRIHAIARISPIALATLANASHAADIKAGDWDLSVGGYVNAFYTHATCTGAQDIVGAGLALQALGCSGTSGRTVVGNGLLPNALVTSAKTKQEGLDIGATLMIGAAVASNDAIGNNSNVDVRQGFFTVGSADIGQVKLGRDYGLFGSSAILGDMTLLGAGAPVSATQRNRVALGHIGAGYTYLGTYGQMAWTLPAAGPVSVTAAILSPVDTNGNVYTGRSEPQVQAQATFKFEGGKAWVAAKHQKFQGPANDGFSMSGGEVGASVAFGPVGFTANVQSGTGLGVLSDGDAGDRHQTNLFAQATFQAGAKTKLGLSWGESRLRDGTGTDLRSNRNVTLGVYHSLTKSVTLTGELSDTRSESVAGSEARMKGVAVGGIVFF